MTIETIPDLWGSISVDVVSPLAVLRNQAGRLSTHTRGLLTADIRTSTDQTGLTHTFQVVAPSLGGYRYDLFSATHGRDLVYPVRIMFRPWQQDDRPAPVPDDPYPLILSTERNPDARRQRATFDAQVAAAEGRAMSRVADTTADLIELVGKVLTSGHTRSVISSLLAKSNETASPPAA